MDFFETVRARASYRGAFTDAPVPREHLEQIVNAGVRAPSGYNGQSTAFVVVTEAVKLAAIAELTGSQDSMTTARAIIAVIMDPSATAEREFSFGIEDYAAATENMLLAVTALGYASVWIDGALRRNGVARSIGALLGVPPSQEVRVILPIGVPVGTPRQADKRGLGERAWFESYGATTRGRAPG